MAKVRIQKLIAEAGYCSRRKAEELIKSKKVKINGHLASLGDKAEYKIMSLLMEKNLILKERKVTFI